MDTCQRRSRVVPGCVVLAALWLCATPGPARAQAQQEEPDSTRLDVERLPPEALEISRDMFAQGLYLRGLLGGRGFLGGIGRLSKPGFYAGLELGYEITGWLSLLAAAEVSQHETSAPAPPSPSTFQLYSVLAALRFTVALSTRAALFLDAEGGLDWSSGNYLEAYGLLDAGQADLMYGGSLGFDWHMKNRHHSLGIVAGGRLYPNLDGSDAERAIGVHSALYLKYVF